MAHNGDASERLLEALTNTVGLKPGKPLTRAQMAGLADAVEVDLATVDMSRDARLRWEGALVALRLVLGR